jgi:hypothetical protein
MIMNQQMLHSRIIMTDAYVVEGVIISFEVPLLSHLPGGNEKTHEKLS